MYSEEEYEVFICEWTSSILGKYAGVFKSKGGGDKGCDVIGFYDSVPSEKWDNYQCKHYDHPIAPAELSAEIIKVIFYCFKGDYSVPQKYYFAAPQGLSNQTLELLRKPEELRKRLAEDWNDCTPDSKLKITDSKLSKHLAAFDLSIVSFIEPQNLIDQHGNTVWHARRFGGGLKPRPALTVPPETVETSELVYISELQEVYGEQEGKVLSFEEIKGHEEHSNHFLRQRRYFYSAESLKQFARETLPNNGDFDDLQQQVFDGVVEVAESKHQTSLERLDQTLSKSKSVQLSDHVLSTALTPADRGGICHQLVNDKRLKWKKN